MARIDEIVDGIYWISTTVTLTASTSASISS